MTSSCFIKFSKQNFLYLLGDIRILIIIEQEAPFKSEYKTRKKVIKFILCKFLQFFQLKSNNSFKTKKVTRKKVFFFLFYTVIFQTLENSIVYKSFN
jgi:hypothetical protein